MTCPKHLATIFLGGALAALLSAPGCADLDDNVGESEHEIIGGSSVSVSTRRSLGLVELITGCGGALFHQDWVITAEHCLLRQTVNSNTFSIPRTDSGVDTRVADHISALSTSDLAIVHLAPATAGMMWPNVTRTMNTASANSLVGQSVTCYGRGSSAYANPGLTGSGPWKSLTKTVASVNVTTARGPELRINATSDGRDIVALGDSGGPCFTGNQIAAVVSTISTQCSDPLNCEATITKVTGAGLRITSDFASYIQQAPQRTAHPQFFSIAPRAGWKLYNYSFSLPEYAKVASGSMVKLRGRAQTDEVSLAPFNLPTGARPSARVYVPIATGSGQNAQLVIQQGGGVTFAFDGPAPALPYSIVLDGVQFALSATDTTALTLQNGWVAAGFSTRAPRARKVANMVYLQGAVSNPSTTPNAVALTLPSTFLPTTDVYIPVTLCNAAKGRLKIKPDGSVKIESLGAFSNATCLTSLEGASFATTTAGYTSASYENGWSGAPFSTRQVRFINDGGIVRFQGAAGGGTANVVFTLPAQFRPATGQYFWIDGCNAGKTLAYVLPQGHVFSLPTGGGVDPCFASFEGASFGL